MIQLGLFPNEYQELLRIAPGAAQYVASDVAGTTTLALPPEARMQLLGLVEQAVAQTERDYQALGRQIWLTRPAISDDEYTRLDAEHGALERRIRVLSRIFTALLETGAA